MVPIRSSETSAIKAQTRGNYTKRNILQVESCYRQMRFQLDCVWNVMAHTLKPDFVFRRNGRVHLNRRGRQFSRLLTAELCASAVVMLHTPCSEVVWRVLATHSIRQFPLHFPTLRRRGPSHFNWTLLWSGSQHVELSRQHQMTKNVKNQNLLNTTNHSVLINMAATCFCVILIKALIWLYRGADKSVARPDWKK